MWMSWTKMSLPFPSISLAFLNSMWIMNSFLINTFQWDCAFNFFFRKIIPVIVFNKQVTLVSFIAIEYPHCKKKKTRLPPPQKKKLKVCLLKFSWFPSLKSDKNDFQRNTTRDQEQALFLPPQNYSGKGPGFKGRQPCYLRNHPGHRVTASCTVPEASLWGAGTHSGLSQHIINCGSLSYHRPMYRGQTGTAAYEDAPERGALFK